MCNVYKFANPCQNTNVASANYNEQQACCKSFLFWCSAWHCIMARQRCNRFTWFAVLHSSMVPGNLPSHCNKFRTEAFLDQHMNNNHQNETHPMSTWNSFTLLSVVLCPSSHIYAFHAPCCRCGNMPDEMTPTMWKALGLPCLMLSGISQTLLLSRLVALTKKPKRLCRYYLCRE